MWTFFGENLVTIVLILLLVAAIGLAVRFAWKHRHSCGGCAGCPHAEACRKQGKHSS